MVRPHRSARRSLAAVLVLAFVGLTGPVSTPASAGVAPPRSRKDLQSFTGLGTWVDAYDYSREYTNGSPSVSPAVVDTMWRAGVKTIYIQASKFGPNSPNAILSPDLLGAFLGRAHYRGMRVVAWYLPSFASVQADLARLLAIRKFRDRGGQAFDAIGVDIEWRNDVPDHDIRNRRLVELTKRLRYAVPDIPLTAIVLPPVVTDIINRNYWPRFPWRTLGYFYDVWQPMGYWTNRSVASGWRDAYRYTYENIRLTRRNLYNANAPVHIVGGIGDKCTSTDYQRFIAAARNQRALGASVYDWKTTAASAYSILRNAPRPY